MSDLLNAVKQMKGQITQLGEIIALLCERRSENEDEVACDKIGKIMENTESHDY